MKFKILSLILIIVGIYVYIVSHAETILPNEPFAATLPVIEQIKPVQISGYKAFNAGVLPLENGEYLFASRKRAESAFASVWKRFFLKENVKGLVIGELDKNFKEKKNINTTYQATEKVEDRDIQYIDPRLMRIGDEIYMVYCQQINRDTRIESEAYLHFAKLEKRQGKWKIVSDKRIEFENNMDFEEFYQKGLVQKNFEKNWMPFCDNGEVFFVYLMEPDHVVLKLDLKTAKAKIYSREKNPFSKQFNDARGSTPAVFDEELGEWITLYHFVYPTERKITGRKTHAYFFGGYTFSKDKPYKVIRKTKGPLAGDTIYNNFQKIVFPTSLVRENDDYLIFYGDDDKTNKVARISRKKLLETMQCVGDLDD
ncbi:MAG: hypothetical protein S4CHLAM20_12590 [Chlamydiia bacterium]|nr:hypothetical protein [Chlamydiia bacterium]